MDRLWTVGRGNNFFGIQELLSGFVEVWAVWTPSSYRVFQLTSWETRWRRWQFKSTTRNRQFASSTTHASR